MWPTPTSRRLRTMQPTISSISEMGVETSPNGLVDMLREVTNWDLQSAYRPQGQMFVTCRVSSTENANWMLVVKATVLLQTGLQDVGAQT